MTLERARPECDVRSRNALTAGTEQGSGLGIKSCQSRLDDLLMKTPINLSRLGIHRREMNNDNDREDV